MGTNLGFSKTDYLGYEGRVIMEDGLRRLWYPVDNPVGGTVKYV